MEEKIFNPLGMADTFLMFPISKETGVPQISVMTTQEI